MLVGNHFKIIKRYRLYKHYRKDYPLVFLSFCRTEILVTNLQKGLKRELVHQFIKSLTLS